MYYFIRVVCIEKEKNKLRSISDEEQLSCPECGERMRMLVDKVKLFTENLSKCERPWVYIYIITYFEGG